MSWDKDRPRWANVLDQLTSRAVEFAFALVLVAGAVALVCIGLMGLNVFGAQ